MHYIRCNSVFIHVYGDMWRIGEKAVKEKKKSLGQRECCILNALNNATKLRNNIIKVGVSFR